jgi:2-hydroxychromene-2-carboxylate isomerase
MSALSPKAGVAECVHHVRYVPKAELNAIHFPLTRGCHMREGKRTQHDAGSSRLLVRFRFYLFLPGGDAGRAACVSVMVRFRPFLLGPLFKAQGWSTSPFNLYPAKGRYMWRDLERICFDLDLPFRQPEPFPQNSLLAARVALVGLRSSWGEEFCRGVFRAQFGDGRQIDDPTIIGDIFSQLHIEAAPVLEAARAEMNKAALLTQTGEAKQLGIFGAPTFATAGSELFWGNDRLERAIAWARMGVDPIATD